MCIIWKALYPYVLDARVGLWVSLAHAFTCACTTNQAELLPTSWLGRSTRGLQPGGHVHMEAAICYPYNRHPLQAPAPLNLSVMACHSLKRTQAHSLCLSENLISHSMPASRIELKHSLPDLDLNQGRRESSARLARRHCGLFRGLAHWATETDGANVTMIVWTHQLYSCHNMAAGWWLCRTSITLFVLHLQQAQYKQQRFT